jgi:hypothetical protein
MKVNSSIMRLCRCVAPSGTSVLICLSLLKESAIKLRRLSLQLLPYGVADEVSNIDMAIATAKLVNQLRRSHSHPSCYNLRFFSFHFLISSKVHNRKHQRKAHKKWVLEVLLIQEIILFIMNDAKQIGRRKLTT